MNKRCFVFLLLPFSLGAQLPDTDIWLFKLKAEKEIFSVEKGINTTNRPGYDNQPSFSEDGKKIWYVSIREDKQADVYAYLIGDKKSVQLTKTAESEYSPTFVSPASGINCVVVEKDSTQRIWQYDEKTGAAKSFLFDEDSVGYFTYLNTDTVLYYKLTNPHSLRMRSLKTGADVFIASGIVRGFKAINRHEFVFGIKDSASVSFYRYHTVLQKAFPYCNYPSLSEDIVWHSAWGLLKSENAEILQYSDKEKKWIKLFDLSPFGIKKITRFAFDNKNKSLVVVDNK
jgi:hypothetical protein